MPRHPLASLTAKQLKKAAVLRERIDRLETELNKILTVGGSPVSATTRGKRKAPAKPKVTKKKRRMSAAGRARIAAAARARWAKRKAAGKNHL